MKKRIIIITLIALGFVVGAATEKKTDFISYTKNMLITHTPWDDTKDKKWGSEFREVSIPSSIGSSPQKAMFLSATQKAPLLISLHTWSGDYKQHDPLSEKAAMSGWNYIHPDFRGPNSTTDACLSEQALADIDDAVTYAINNGNVDSANIFVVGVSGGGYAGLGSYLKTKHKINTFMVWVPISDLNLWYKQSRDRKSTYSEDILACTDSGKDIDSKSARLRSPLHWNLPKDERRIEIYAGINDGHTGSVPVSHSILFFNKLARQYDKTKQIDVEETVMILDRNIERFNEAKSIGNRELIFERKAGPASIYIFDGTHEMLTDYAFNRIESLIQ
ncbi:alpha/beta hydrolase family protein [Vibrio parahaemolyticus]|uniref:alpha/beta hydrolase family protein n=1 Tax=Vibrio parahaemolyticus TaxID=670 RepID=UPI00226A263C|nr:prolyl oligopeptidase family serine peptidase [Vibrio parahaemolyticus]MCX8761319.1 prolyl oligopeptidase family serine peptidase [Vibrio parahaemolyticus]